MLLNSVKFRKANRIIQELHRHEHVALLAGGCVRDFLRQTEPHDFDIATSAHPDEVQRLFPQTYGVGAAFGVVLVILEGDSFEVATFRTDGEYLDGRRPSRVDFGTPEQDASRRDFTINGLFLDPLENRIIDYVGGQEDLKRGLIRCIGNPSARFAEDKLRLLRAVRFAANLGFQIHEETWTALREMSPQIIMVSAERIRDELIKIITGPHPADGMSLLDSSGLLRVVLPEVSAMKGVEQPPQFHPEGDVWTHTLGLLEKLSNPSIILGFSALLHDVGKPPTFKITREPDGSERIRFNEHDKVGSDMTQAILQRLRFPNNEIEAITTCVANHMQFRDVQNMRLSTLKRMLARPTIETELELHRIDCLSSHGSTENYNFVKAKINELGQERVAPPPLLRGEDVMALGIKRGPGVGRLLSSARELQLEEKLKNREEALEWLKQQVSAGK